MMPVSAQARPQVTGTNGEDEDADQAANEGVGEPGLDPGAGVGAGQAADAERDAGRLSAAVAWSGREVAGDERDAVAPL
jgi:hypothetical protein